LSTPRGGNLSITGEREKLGEGKEKKNRPRACEPWNGSRILGIRIGLEGLSEPTLGEGPHSESGTKKGKKGGKEGT